MKKKLLIAIPVLLLVVGGAWKFKFAGAGEAAAKPKVAGEVYVLGKQFLVNLHGGKYAQVTVGLVLEEGETAAGEAGGEEAAAVKPPEGFGPMPQEGVVRDVITDRLTGLDADDLVEERSRARLKRMIAADLRKHTDVPIEDVLFTDVTVQ